MSNLGQKIKEAFTGHHDQEKSDVKTPDVNAPGAFPSDEPSTKHHSDHNKLTKEPPTQIAQDKSDDVEKGVQHHTGHSHHDPEPETKQATSDAGNYPYWGNLPREGGQHVHRSEGPDSSVTNQHHGLDKDSGLAAGALAAGTTTAGAGYLGSKSSKDQETNRTDEIAPVEDRRDHKLDNEESNIAKGAGAGAAAAAGTTYLVTRDKAEDDRSGKKSNDPTHSDTTQTTKHTKTSTTTEKPVETATPTKTTSAGDNDTHKKEEEALAAGAGVAGLAGAGYYASQKGDKSHDATRDTVSHGTQGANTQPTTSHHDPVTEAQKATSAAGNYPYWTKDASGNTSAQHTGVAEAATPSKTTSSGDNDSHRKEEALAAGAGASGLAGAGYLASKKLDDREAEKQSSPGLAQSTHGAKESITGHRDHASTGRHDPEYDAKRATSGAGNYPHWDNDKKDTDNNRGLAAAGLGGAGLAGAGYLASNRSEERKDELPGSTRETTSGIAAPGSLAQRDTTSRVVDPTTSGGIHNTVVGAGSSEYSPPVSSSNTTGAGYPTQPSSQATQPAAQAAAQQAWNKQQSASPTTFEDKSKDNKHSDLKYAAAGTAFGAGATGLAANYGQGKEHETNPRTNESEKVAERALGSDGKPHAPSSTEGSGIGNQQSASSGLTSGVAGLAGQSPSTGTGSKVLHKCENCGHDNDISRYFNKDAIFRSQQ